MDNTGIEMRDILHRWFGLPDQRCFECDSRYCPPNECQAKEGYIYVVGLGYVPGWEAEVLEKHGHTVYWDQQGFIKEGK